MARFRVTYDVMSAEVDSLRATAAKLLEYKGQLEAISNEMDGRDSTMNQLKQQVRECADELAEMEAELQTLAQALVEAETAYAGSESEALGLFSKSPEGSLGGGIVPLGAFNGPLLPTTGILGNPKNGPQTWADLFGLKGKAGMEAGMPETLELAGTPYISLDITQYSPDVQRSIAACLEGIDKYKNDPVMLEYNLDALDNVLGYGAGWGRDIENVKERGRGVTGGAFQFVGGATESLTGATIAAGASWTGIGIPVGVAGGYMVVDGTSNMAGGAYKAFSAVVGDNEGDTWNFMKAGYKLLSPEYGENFYHGTQIGIGLFTIGRGITQLPGDAVKVCPRVQNIARANAEGLTSSTNILDVGDKVLITTQTPSGMILTRTVIYKSEIATGTLLIGVDAYNANGARESIE